jgi:uncharacterized protein YceK
MKTLILIATILLTGCSSLLVVPDEPHESKMRYNAIESTWELRHDR